MYGILLEAGNTKDLLGCQVSSLSVMSYNLFGKMIKLHLYPLLASEDSSVVIRNLLLVCDSGFLMDSSSFFLFFFFLLVPAPFPVSVFSFLHRHD